MFLYWIFSAWPKIQRDKRIFKIQIDDKCDLGAAFVKCTHVYVNFIHIASLQSYKKEYFFTTWYLRRSLLIAFKKRPELK